MNETNYNNINLNNKWYISAINKNENSEDEEDNEDNEEHNEQDNEENNKDNTEEQGEVESIYNCRIKNITNNKVKDKDLFFKMAPLLDPFKYLIGKYNVNDTTLFNLPNIQSDESNCNSKLLDLNNSAYVDGLFLFLSSKLIYDYNFYHSVDYYGSYLALKNNFILNVYDDIVIIYLIYKMKKAN